MVDATHCPACGHVNAIAAETCASCGEPLPGGDHPIHPGETFRDPDDLSFPEEPFEDDQTPSRPPGSGPKRVVATDVEPGDLETRAEVETEIDALRGVAERMRRPRSAAEMLAAAHRATGTRPAHYAGFVIRLVAFAIDAAVLGAFTVPLTVAALYGVEAGLVASGSSIELPETEEALGRLVGIASLAMAVIYFTALHRGTGQTIGKAIVGIAVRRARDLAGIGIVRSLVRVVGYALSSSVFFLGFLSVVFGPRKRGWHDYLAGTCVVHMAPEEV